MERRLRNLLNWIAFALPLLYLLSGANSGNYYYWFENTILPWTAYHLTSEVLAGTVMIYLYLAYLGAQYVVWKDVVLLPWRFKVEGEMKHLTLNPSYSALAPLTWGEEVWYCQPEHHGRVPVDPNPDYIDSTARDSFAAKFNQVYN